ncbi:RAS guanyl-releasing protein 1-like [Anguilla rostrata]|uniref:RAS guanyl-releasing protein 1-like n=1 Tax=Anguilla rostrata TaxID=7938 RepID=UPI0030D0B549
MNRKTKRKSRQGSLTVAGSQRAAHRRMTCPTPQEINQALQGPRPTPPSHGLSLEELIQRCLHSFDSEGKLGRGAQLVHMTLMMHSWVVSSHTFAHKLLSLYEESPEEMREQRRTQICHLLRHWVNKFPAAFEADPLLEQEMAHLWSLVGTEGEEPHCLTTDTSYLLSSNHPPIPLQVPSPTVKKRKVSLLFDHMEPDQMAQHLSYLEFKIFCRVSYLDFHSYVVRGSVRDNPALERSVMLCNGVSQWVQLMILSRHTAQQRAQVFTKFIHVAQKLRSLQNFNTLMAVIGGLCHSCISRLKDTASLLPQDVTKTLSELTELLSSRGNYRAYRQVYRECSGFKVPILGVHLKDLISLNEALPDYLEDDKINLGKLQHLYSNIADLLAVHDCTPPFQANKDLLHLLTLSLDLYYTEDEIYDLSYAKEPKYPKIQPTTPVKPPVVGEWGSGVTPRLDPETISTHVKLMVDSIMKNYDLNQDGYISLEDFENIASNFPFSFCKHESDREGEISREEITSYFMRGMSICAKLGLNFLHNFHEVTYKRPTFCNTCGGFLWGVIKQGYRCRDCGINCHKHCKDKVGLECKKRFSVSGGSCPCTPNPDTRPKINSSSSEEDAFVFPRGEETDQAEDRSPPWVDGKGSSRISHRATQTEPGFWTPGPVDRSGGNLNSHTPRSPLEKDKAAPSPPTSPGQEKVPETSENRCAQATAVPTPALVENMEELRLQEDRRKEPD